MSSHDLFIIVLFIGILVAFTPLLGKWLANVLQGEPTWFSRLLGPVESCAYRMAGVDPSREMDWKKYLAAVLLFNAAGFLILFLSLLCQKWLPLNPAGTENMRWDIAFNTAVSFMTNTNWQFYSGEGPEGISYFVQMTGLGVQNFVSAATGIAVMAALIRGLKRKCASTLGNFWADLTRSTLYFLIPISVVVALLLVSQGVVQSFDGPTTVAGMDGVEQVIPNGPAASQVAIKQLGTNGGGFFGNNSTHPFENPTPFSNMIEMLSLLLIGCACPYAYGVMIGKRKQGWIIFGAMMLLLVTTIGLSQWAEHAGNPLFPGLEMLEGKEVLSRHHEQFPVVRSHYRFFQRFRELHALQHVSAGRRHRPVQHAAGGSDFWGTGLRFVRHADVRHDYRVPVRADGGPHARIPGQKD